jgi:hypothetical protein
MKQKNWDTGKREWQRYMLLHVQKISQQEEDK